MTPDDIIEMARQANATQIGHKLIAFHFFIAELEAFAKLVDDKVTAREREAMLDLVDAYAKNNTDLAEAIRARGES